MKHSLLFEISTSPADRRSIPISGIARVKVLETGFP